MKRCLTKLVVFLLLGAIVNVAVAWGCVLRSPPEYKGGPTKNYLQSLAGEWISPDGYEGGFNKRAGQMQIIQVRGLFVMPRYGNSPPPQLSDEEYGDLIPDWSTFAKSDPFAKYTNADSFTDVAAGWPLLGLHFFGPSSWAELEAGVNWNEDRWDFDLPYIPIWPGFAVNTIFYAVILWMLTLGPITARRMIRRKRGRCIKCGYDLRGDFSSGCPECGWRRDDVS